MIEFLFIFILQASVEIPFIQELIPQQIEERVCQDIQIKESRVLSIEEIYMPGNVKLRNDFAYILDYQPAPRVLKN